MVDIKVPVLPESVADATVAKWYKQPGDAVKRDENLVDLETDKVMLEVPAPADGVLKAISKPEGETVTADEVIGTVEEGAKAEEKVTPEKTEKKEETSSAKSEALGKTEEQSAAAELSPAVRRLVAEHNVDVSKVSGSGKDGRIVKEDVEKFIEAQKKTPATQTPAPSVSLPTGNREERRVPMSRLRARIAERLVEVQQSSAILTTFNEINMQPVMSLRSKYKEKFEKQHGVKLGFMSFFVKAAVEALKRFPAVNASIDEKDVVYHGYFDVGIAVSTERGLVVPVVRDADQLSMAEIEQSINEYAQKAREGKLTMEEMTGGTFTITNGGVFGSMLSTPIINPPQSGILGMHNIVKRPMVINDEVVIRPVMYVALSYDHRIIDGKDSVSFLVTIKELLEDPARLLLEL